MVKELYSQLVLALYLCKMATCSVHWMLGQPMIELGKPLRIVCDFHGTIRPNATRQWTVGENNRLLCLNGVPTNPTKYNEIQDSAKRYTLLINEISESDLELPYCCRIGFDSDEKILAVNKSNFRHFPNGNTTRTEYRMDNENYVLTVDFIDVYPVPCCSVLFRENTINMSITHEHRRHIFYNVSLSLESAEAFHICNTPVNVQCQIGDKEYNLEVLHKFQCIDNNTADHQTVIIVTCSLVSVVLLVLLCLCTAICIKMKYKRHHSNDDQNIVYTTVQEAIVTTSDTTSCVQQNMH